jgi:hypothetical protein
MNPQDPEQYIRGLEREVGRAPGAAPPLFRTRVQRAAQLATTTRGRLILVCAGIAVPAMLMFLAHYASKTTVHGDLIR